MGGVEFVPKKTYRVTRCERCGENEKIYVALDMWGNILSTAICKSCKEYIEEHKNDEPDYEVEEYFDR